MVLLYVSPVKTCDTFILERTVELFQSVKLNESAQTWYLILNILKIVCFFYVLEV